MKEYKVEICRVKAAEEQMNFFAQDGWRVVSVMPNNAAGYGMVIIFERDA